MMRLVDFQESCACFVIIVFSCSSLFCHCFFYFRSSCTLPSLIFPCYSSSFCSRRRLTKEDRFLLSLRDRGLSALQCRVDFLKQRWTADSICNHV
jgi:hypothetical protein